MTRRLSIIVPCYNEEAVLAESYRRTRAVIDRLPCEGEIIYINDGSRDGTRNMLNELADEDPRVKVLHFSRNFGHQPAVSAGIHQCTADWAVIMDADLQDPPELIPDILALSEREGANSVYCVRRSREKETLFKRLSARLFYRTMNRMSEVQFPLDTGDFRLIDRKIMDQFKRLPEHGKYIRGLISWIGFKQVPFYYERKARVAGETKYPLSKMLRFASNALLYFSKKPLRLASSLGFLAVIVGLLLALWTLLQLLTIGVLGQYIGVLFDEIKNRPEYIIDECRNCTDS